MILAFLLLILRQCFDSYIYVHDFEQHQGNLTGVNVEAPTAYPLEDISSWSFNDVSHIYVTLFFVYILFTFYLFLIFYLNFIYLSVVCMCIYMIEHVLTI